MSSSPHYCKYIWLCYPKHRKCAHFLLEWVNVSFPFCSYKSPLLISITKRVKSKAACWSCCIKQHRRFTPHMISSENIKKSALRLIFEAITLVFPSFPVWASTRHLLGVKHLSCWSKTFLSFSYWNIYTLALLCMPSVLH